MLAGFRDSRPQSLDAACQVLQLLEHDRQLRRLPDLVRTLDVGHCLQNGSRETEADGLAQRLHVAEQLLAIEAAASVHWRNLPSRLLLRTPTVTTRWVGL